MWDDSDERGRGNDYIKPGDKRGGIEGRRARRGGNYRRRGAGGGDGLLQDGGSGGGGGGGGAISRAVSDEDLFESLFGDQRGGRVDVGGGATELAGQGDASSLPLIPTNRLMWRGCTYPPCSCREFARTGGGLCREGR